MMASCQLRQIKLPNRIRNIHTEDNIRIEYYLRGREDRHQLYDVASNNDNIDSIVTCIFVRKISSDQLEANRIQGCYHHNRL